MIEWGSRNTQRYAAIIVTTIIIVTQVMNSIYLYYFSPSTFKIPNIFHAPIETIPFDSGWIGFAFILVNGLLLSYVLVKDKADTTERLLLSIGLGFGVTYTVMILIGILWEISLFTIILTQMSLFIILIIAAFRRGLKLNLNSFSSLKKNDHIPKLSLLEIVMLIAMGIFVVVAIYQTVAYPSMEWDSLAYGVNYAKIIFENGKIPLIAGPSIGIEMSASYPPGVQLLAVDLYVFAGNASDFYFRILQPIFGLATLVATYKFAMLATKNRTTSVFAIFILSVIPAFWEFFIHETYLMCLTFMATLSAFFFFKAYYSNDNDRKKYEIAATIFCCFAALTSYTGLFSFGLLPLYSIKKGVSAKRLTGLAILASSIVLPWYIRNLLLLGNPIYPFLGIGNYLDPMLLSSTTQHFQTWSQVPFLDWISISSKIGAVVLFLAVIGLTFDKRKTFLLISPCYLFFVGVAIMAVHIPFIRYLLIALPALAVIIAASTKSLLAAHNLVERSTAIILVSMILVSGVVTLTCINSFKPTYTRGDDKWGYLSQVFEEGDAWQWINENTPPDARIATYDIKEYYIERNVVSLDGSEAAPLYKMDNIEDCIDFLEERNVTYVLSVPWASPSSNQLPSAYRWCVLTRYLGDSSYLPPVYVGLNGTAVYHVGPLEEKTIYASFAQDGFAPPINHVTVNLTITNSTYPSSGKFYLPIPVDYKTGLMMTSVNSSKRLVNVELWNGIIPETMNTNPLDKSKLVEKWPLPSANSTDIENPSFVWQVNRAGYFTFLITNREDATNESFNVTVDIRFYNYWDIKSLFVPQGSEIYNFTASNETYPVIKTLYIQADEPFLLNISSKTANKKMSIEVFNGFLPSNAVINWSAQYDKVKTQPNQDGLGEVDPYIQNLSLPKGQYSILVVNRDSYTEQEDISLKVEFTSQR